MAEGPYKEEVALDEHTVAPAVSWKDNGDVLAGVGAVAALAKVRRPGARFLLAALLGDVDEQRLILVAEDDEATRPFLLDDLAADGFRAAGASSAGEGLRAIEVRQPHLVVLDLALEDSSGLDLLDRLRGFGWAIAPRQGSGRGVPRLSLRRYGWRPN